MTGRTAARRVALMGIVVGLAGLTTACFPLSAVPDPPAPRFTPQPAPPGSPPLTSPTSTSSTTTTTTTIPPPHETCGAGHSAVAGDLSGSAVPTAGLDVTAVVKHSGRLSVLTRRVHSRDELTKFEQDAGARGGVLSLATNTKVHALTETATWGWNAVDYSDAWAATPPTRGTGVRVAVVDTGVDATHPDLAGRVVPGVDFVDGNTVDGRSDPNGHGTFLAGIVTADVGNGIGIKGGAPAATVVPVRALDATGAGTEADVAAGVLWAADRTQGNAKVINLSLGGPDDGGFLGSVFAAIEDPSNPNYTHPVIVVAAGNDASTGHPVLPEYPAAYGGTNPYCSAFSELLPAASLACASGPSQPDECSTVTTGSTYQYSLAPSSNQPWNGMGKPTGVAAPGVNVISTFPGGYAIGSGTSFATAFTTAAATLVVAHCGHDSPAQIVSRIETTAHDLGPVGPDTAFGYGAIDANLAIKSC